MDSANRHKEKLDFKKYTYIYGHVKKSSLCDIEKIEKSQIFVLFENEASYEDFHLSCYGYFA